MEKIKKNMLPQHHISYPKMIIDLSKHVSRFLEETRGIPFEHHGVYKSELFILYCLHKEFKDDLFLESGLYEGFSTRLLLRLITDPYIGIDIDIPSFHISQIKNKNFTFRQACGIKLLPQLISEHSDKSISILIDGPKSDLANRLKNDILKDFNNVSFVALHDTYDGLENANELRIFESKNNPEFNAKYFELLNRAQDGETDIFSLRNIIINPDLTYAQTYPSGPGISIYSKHNMEFKL